jgi:type I restriction enzyme R subunit
VGIGVLHEEAMPLSRLIDVINERFGTDFNEADQLFFDQIIEEAVRVDSLQQAAQVNPIDKFQLVFRQVLESLFIDRMEMNEELFAKFMNDAEFQDLVANGIGQRVYARLPKKLEYESSSVLNETYIVQDKDFGVAQREDLHFPTLPELAYPKMIFLKVIARAHRLR